MGSESLAAMFGGSTSGSVDEGGESPVEEVRISAAQGPPPGLEEYGADGRESSGGAVFPLPAGQDGGQGDHAGEDSSTTSAEVLLDGTSAVSGTTTGTEVFPSGEQVSKPLGVTRKEARDRVAQARNGDGVTRLTSKDSNSEGDPAASPSELESFDASSASKTSPKLAFNPKSRTSTEPETRDSAAEAVGSQEVVDQSEEQESPPSGPLRRAEEVGDLDKERVYREDRPSLEEAKLGAEAVLGRSGESRRDDLERLYNQFLDRFEDDFVGISKRMDHFLEQAALDPAPSPHLYNGFELICLFTSFINTDCCSLPVAAAKLQTIIKTKLPHKAVEM